MPFHPMTDDEARAFFAWRYPPPYECYNADSRHLAEDMNREHW